MSRRLALCLTLLVFGPACDATEPPSTAGAPTAAEAGLAVVCSDYASTAVALMDPEGARVTAPLLIHSGSAPPGVLVALSGDISLPTAPVAGGAVVLLDRFPNGVVTWVDPVSATVIRQVDLGRGFAPNIRDLVPLGGARWLVTRANPNRQPDPGALDRGDDLLLIESDGTPLTAVDAGDPDGFPGRPDRLLRRSDTEVWVSLNRASLDFTSWRDGMVGRVRAGADGSLGWLERVEYPGTRCCGGLTTDGVRTALACPGSFDTGAHTVAPAGSAVLTLDDSAAETARLVGDDPRVGAPFGQDIAMMADGRVALVALGDFDGAVDRVLAWDPDADTVVELYRASAPFIIGSLATTASGLPVFPVADPAHPAVCVVREGGVACTSACDATGLPPRLVRRLAPAVGGQRRP
ncbi:MAG: hypothetical protein H6744_18840 [Deltaproteobacteria bacterium]|nr:hypothetical protein [Deltaproteobacteria bacterium]MCB9788739.1 hypothetical protein [Deltaproteobacteria bacterium]